MNNGVDKEVHAELAVEPDQPAWSNVNTIWEHRRAAQWPPVVAAPIFFLRGNGSLSPFPPPMPEVGPVLNGRIVLFGA
mgnify:CR=1 FL=1